MVKSEEQRANMAEKTSPRAPASVSIGRQLDKEKINVLTKRIESLLSSNNSLRQSAERNEKDTHDIVLYFQREMEMKDDIISRLNEELVKKEGQMRAEIDRLKETYDDEIADLKAENASIIDDLKGKLVSIENDLSNLESYKRDKEYHDRKLSQIEANYAKEKAEALFALDEQERKFIEQKAHMLKDLEDQKAAFRNAALKEAREALDAETKKLAIENARFSEELKFHHTISREHQVEKTKLETSLVTAKREIALLTEKEEEYAKQLHLKSKEIKQLRERVEELEKLHMASIEKFRQRTKDMKTSMHKELENATLDAAGLRRLIKIKNKELQHMKTLAATIIQQRSDVETFLLESLTEVQDIIRKERRKQRIESDQQMLNSRLAEGIRKWEKGEGSMPIRTGTFPKIKPHNTHHMDPRGAHVSNLPSREEEKVYIKDLTWEDKELVLRFLFAKINGKHNDIKMDLRRRSARDSKDDSFPVFISEGKGLPIEMDGQGDDGGPSYESSFALPGFEDGSTELGIPFDQERETDDKYDFVVDTDFPDLA